MSFKLSCPTVSLAVALAAADEIEKAVGEIVNGKRKASHIPMEPIARLVQFARDQQIQEEDNKLEV